MVERPVLGWAPLSLTGFRICLSVGALRAVMAREYVWLECTETGMRNYRVSKETRGAERLSLMKYCPRLRRHTLHKESRKK